MYCTRCCVVCQHWVLDILFFGTFNKSLGERLFSALLYEKDYISCSGCPFGQKSQETQSFFFTTLRPSLAIFSHKSRRTCTSFLFYQIIRSPRSYKSRRKHSPFSYYKVPFVDNTSVIRGSSLVAASSAFANALKSASIL